MQKSTYKVYDGIITLFGSELMEAVKQESDDQVRRLAKKVTADMGFNFDLGLIDSRAAIAHLCPMAE